MIAKSKILKGEVATFQAEHSEVTKSQAEMDKLRQEEKTLLEANDAELSKGLAGIRRL